MESVTFLGHIPPAVPRLNHRVPSACRMNYSNKSHLAFHHSSDCNSLFHGSMKFGLSWSSKKPTNFGFSQFTCSFSGGGNNPRKTNDPKKPDNPREYAAKLKEKALLSSDTGELKAEINKKKVVDPAFAYELELALVEVLLRQGKIEEALECNCLKNTAISSDKRVKSFRQSISQHENGWREIPIEDGDDLPDLPPDQAEKK